MHQFSKRTILDSAFLSANLAYDSALYDMAEDILSVALSYEQRSDRAEEMYNLMEMCSRRSRTNLTLQAVEVLERG